MASSDIFKPVAPGDPFDFPADLYNYVIKAVQAYLRSLRGGGGGAFETAFDPTVVVVENTTGADLPAFSVVGVNAAIDDPAADEAQFLNSPRLVGRTPVADEDQGGFAVFTDGVTTGSLGRAVVSGVVMVKVDAGDGSQFADVADGVTDSLIAAADGSARILWRKSGTGKQWAVVRLGGGGGGDDAPEFAGQVKQGVANGVSGWAMLPLTNLFP